MRLQGGDILAVDPKGQAQVEFQDGAILNLAQGSRAMLLGGARGEEEIALQSGWAKFTQKKSGKGRPYRYQMPLARLSAGEATGVLHPGGDFNEIFLESGVGRFVELAKGGEPAGGRDVKGGEFIARRSGQPATVAPRPSSEFIKTMPGHFRDDLPVLIGRFKTRKAEPKREHEVSYAEVETWLKASPSIRRNFTDRFQGRVKDAGFRNKLIENMQEHPEWDRVLFPEKYEPKDLNQQ
ncbi:MAG TPA: hypothetical protein VK572_01245 [Burkholderiales bacterium]|nr:hypothetical protein [Burkholderiales bacterium]